MGLFLTRARASCSRWRIKSNGSEWSLRQASPAEEGLSSNKAPGTDDCWLPEAEEGCSRALNPLPLALVLALAAPSLLPTESPES